MKDLEAELVRVHLVQRRGDGVGATDPGFLGGGLAGGDRDVRLAAAVQDVAGGAAGKRAVVSRGSGLVRLTRPPDWCGRVGHAFLCTGFLLWMHNWTIWATAPDPPLNLREYLFGSDMGAFDPSAHALFLTVGHSRPGRGGNGMAGRPAVAGGSRSSGGRRHRVKNGRR